MQIDVNHLSSLMERFFEMIEDFQYQTATANNLLKELLQLENPMFYWQSNIPQTGACGPNDSIQYFFHGDGCRVKTDDLLIDWDYGIDGRTDGFDFWRLRSFVADWPQKYSEFTDTDLLRGAFEQAKNRKLIHQPFPKNQDDLFYLNEGK